MTPVVAAKYMLLQTYHGLTLLGNPNSLSTPSSGLCVLSLDTQTPVMPQTTVIPAQDIQWEVVVNVV